MANQFMNNSNDKNVPMSARSFAMARPQQQPAPWDGQTQYVQGLGAMGPDLGGSVKGAMLRQQYDLANAQNARAEEDLGIRKEDLSIRQSDLEIRKDFLAIAQADLGIRQEDLGIRKADLGMRLDKHGAEMDQVQRANAIQKGMGEAFKAGGYSGVVDFLAKTGMPGEAIRMHAAKLELDDKIMQLPVMQMKAKSELATAQMNIYAAGGALAKIILDTPPKERNDAYLRARPMFAPILGNILPEKLNDQAVTDLGLMVAQATPANMLYSAQKSVTQFQSDIGRLNGDILALQQKGATYENSEALRSMMDTRNSYKANTQTAIFKAAQAQFEAQKSQQHTEQTRLQNTDGILQELIKGSEDFNNAAKIDTQMQSNLSTLQKDPYNLQAQNAVISNYLTAMKGGSVSLQEIKEVAGSETWFSKLAKQTGELSSKNFSTKEVQQMSDAWKMVMNNKVSQQRLQEQNYQEYMSSNPTLFNTNSVINRMPSSQYQQTKSIQNVDSAIPEMAQQYPWLQIAPKDLQQKAIIAITQNNKDPKQVEALTMQLMKQRGLIPEQMQQQQQAANPQQMMMPGQGMMRLGQNPQERQ